jgi:cytochrome c oxidase cbb3-type subunit 3
MPTKVEKDALTGTEIRDHEWDGIKELDTPLPKWWIYVFYACILWAIVYFILYPSVPGITGYFKGVLGWSSRAEIAQTMAKVRKEQGKYLDRIRALPLADIRKNPTLLTFAIAGGKAAFIQNCAPCHGPGGVGRKGGYPSLADDAWLWGGTLADIYKTIQVGVRSGATDARINTMPTFGGVDGPLKPAQINDVAEYVLSLTKRSTDAKAAARGAKIFAEQCASCHGKTGQGHAQPGAPALNDQIWLYGDTKQAIVAQITKPKLGVMPTWGARLDNETIKMLALYVHSLGGGK